MPGPSLKTATPVQGSNRALWDGTVAPRHCSFDFEEVSVLAQAFRRMVRELEFDVCEMAFATYLVAKEHGKRFTALPIFLVRGFHHGAIVVNAKSRICSSRDLEGRLVGINRGYTVTAGVWARGVLADEHGVDLEKITWVPFGDEHVAEYRLPSNVVPAGDGKDLAEMVRSGELAAAIGIDSAHPDVVPLIPAPREAALAALRSRGLYPINHLVVVKDEVLEAHPGLAANVFSAFAEAKNRYVTRLREGSVAHPTPVDRTYRRVLEVTGQDPLPYGIEPNRLVIDQFIEHALRQRIVERRPDVEELFAKGTHHLTA